MANKTVVNSTVESTKGQDLSAASARTDKKDVLKCGSEGSMINECNIRRYPEGNSTSFETRQEIHSPKVTDHAFNSAPQAGYKAPTETERIRRENNRNRDHRRRWAVITGPLAEDENPISAKEPKVIR